MARTGSLVFFAAVLLAVVKVSAVDGVSVTVHYEGTHEWIYGGWGNIIRHNIANDRVTSHTTIYSGGDARRPCISLDGTRVAFVTKAGKISIISINGGAVTQLATSNGECVLAFPDNQWIYYNMEGYWDIGSATFRRVNAVTRADEFVVTLKNTSGQPEKTWYFGISNDLTKMAVRGYHDNPLPNGVVAYDLATNDGIMRTSREVNGCGAGMDPEGVYFMNGIGHKGINIRKWSDLSIVESFIHSEVVSWGPDTYNSGVGADRNKWSSNSQDWVCAHVGAGSRPMEGGNQVLYNWKKHKRIVTTRNALNSRKWDTAGDFWVGGVSSSRGLSPIGAKRESTTRRLMICDRQRFVRYLNSSDFSQVVRVDGTHQGHRVGTGTVPQGAYGPGVYILRRSGRGATERLIVVGR